MIATGSSSKNRSRRSKSVASKAALLSASKSKCRVLEALWVAVGEDDAGSLGAYPSGCLKPDSGAAADYDDGLPKELGFAKGRRDCGCGGHGFLRRSL